MVLSAINRYPDAAIPGARYGFDHQIETYVNNADDVAKVVDVAITVANSTAYALTVDGVPIGYTSDASATAGEIRDGLIAAIQANAFANAKVTAAASGNDVRITERDPSKGEVALAESDANLALATVTAHAQKEPMAPGIALEQGPGDRDGRLPVSGGTFRGVTLLSHANGDSELSGDDLFEPRSLVPVLRQGEVWVKVEENVTPASVPHYRHTASGANTQRGAFRASTDGGKATSLAGKAEFRSSASAGGLARLAVLLP